VTTGEETQDQPHGNLRTAVVRVPAATALFWITKALSTAMGEATSDFLVHGLPPAVAVALGFIALVGALILQFRARRYVPWIYWLAVAMVGVFGTMAADTLHVGLGIPYVVSSAFLAVALAAVFVLWYVSEKNLSIHGIYTARREAFYWAAVMATFALGTAVGDMTATTLHLGYLASGLMFAVLLAVPAVAYRWFAMNAILAFWFAYVLTRPLGASFADWMSVSSARGGLALGPGTVSLGLSLLVVVSVVYMTVRATGTRQGLQQAER
jgi:uncharacterized membrane-anchored protein